MYTYICIMYVYVYSMYVYLCVHTYMSMYSQVKIKRNTSLALIFQLLLFRYSSLHPKNRSFYDWLVFISFIIGIQKTFYGRNNFVSVSLKIFIIQVNNTDFIILFVKNISALYYVSEKEKNIFIMLSKAELV